VKLNKVKYIPLYVTKLKNTQESGHSIYGQWITAQFLNKPVGNRNNERPTERFMRSNATDPHCRIQTDESFLCTTPKQRSNDRK